MTTHRGQTTSMTSTMHAPPGYLEEEMERHRRALASLMPSFDPADPGLTVDLWFHKAREIGYFLGYNINQVLPVMQTKLRGEARVWYEALSDADRMQWSIEILGRFKTRWPAPKYIHMLATRKYREGENIMLYFVDKHALLQALGIQGRRAVECTVIETGLLEVEMDVQRRNIDDMLDLLVYFGQLEFNRTFRKTPTLTDETDIQRHGTTLEKHESLLQDRKMYLDWQYAKIHLAEKLAEQRSRSGIDVRLAMNIPEPQKTVRGYEIPEHINSRINTNAKMVSLGVEPHFRHEGRFFDVVVNGGAPMQAYLDNTCGCIALRRREAVLLGLPYHLITNDDHTWLRHYAQDDHLRFGPGCERPLGFAWYQIKIDQVTIMAPVYIVRTEILHVPMLIGQPFTRNTNTTIIECGGYVRVCETNSLVTMNPATTDQSLQVRIGSEGAQPKVMTAQTVQAQKTGEEDKAETCGSVSLVLDLKQRKEEEKKDEEEVMNKEEEAKEKKDEKEEEVKGKKEEGEVVNNEKEENEVVGTEEREDSWGNEQEVWERDVDESSEGEEVWEEVQEEVQEEVEEEKEEVVEKEEKKVQEEEMKVQKEEEEKEEKKKEKEQNDKKSDVDEKEKKVQEVKVQNKVEEEEMKLQEEDMKVQKEEEEKEEKKKEKEQNDEKSDVDEEEKEVQKGKVQNKVEEKEKKLQEKEKKVQKEEKETKEKREKNDERSDVDEKQKDIKNPETLKFSQMVKTIDEPKPKRENSPPSETNEEDWVVVIESDSYQQTCVVS